MPEYSLQWFSFLSFHKDKIVIYGVGQWVDHLMDWAGCNFHHGRIGPVFKNVIEAYFWLRKEVKEGRITERMTLRGHHSGEYECPHGCGERMIVDCIYFDAVKTRDISNELVKSEKEFRERQKDLSGE